jgi:hypothetical protein
MGMGAIINWPRFGFSGFAAVVFCRFELGEVLAVV